MSLTFYCLSGSPFSWKVWLSLEHLGVPYDIEVLSADAGEHRTAPYLAVNPRGKVPAIVDDGFALWESGPTVDYLAETRSSPGRQLWPSDARTHARARRIAAEADGYVYPPVRRLVVELLMRRSGDPDQNVIAESKAALAVEIARMEAQLTQPFLAGDTVSAADFAIYPLTAIIKRVDAKAPHIALDAMFVLACGHGVGVSKPCPTSPERGRRIGAPHDSEELPCLRSIAASRCVPWSAWDQATAPRLCAALRPRAMPSRCSRGPRR